MIILQNFQKWPLQWTSIARLSEGPDSIDLSMHLILDCGSRFIGQAQSIIRSMSEVQPSLYLNIHVHDCKNQYINV